MTTIDVSDLHKLVAQLGAVPAHAIPNVTKAVAVNALKIKGTWNTKLYREGHAKRTGYSVTYDVAVTGAGVSAEIGAVTGSGRQAYITRLLEYGSVNNPPHGYGSAALDEHTADLDRGIAKALDDAHKAAGL